MRYKALEGVLDERLRRLRRLFAGAEALVLGRGGQAAVARATGLSRGTVGRGMRELQAPGGAGKGRVRRPGGGRKRTVVTDPSLRDDLDRMAAAAIAFFAPGNDPRLWSDGWYPEVAAAERAASQATPPGVWWDGGVAPMLVVQGLQDRIAPPGNGRALKEAFDDRVTLVEVDGAGHALLPEQPDAVAEAVITFLREH